MILLVGWWPIQPQMYPVGDVASASPVLGIHGSDLASIYCISNTSDEACVIDAMLPPGRSVLLVTSTFHLLRARLPFERAGLQLLTSADGLQPSRCVLREVQPYPLPGLVRVGEVVDALQAPIHS